MQTADMLTPSLSVVLPIYNEADSLPVVLPEITAALQRQGESYEILAVDDGSTDESLAVLRRLQATEPNLRVVQFRRNFGQTAAFTAGFDYARGETIITMDADGQNDPADVPRVLAKLREGRYDLVVGWRQGRKEPWLTRRVPSAVANWLIANASDLRLHDRGCSLKAVRSDLAKQIRLYGELHRFMPEVASLVGARVTEIPVNDRPREAGTSKYKALARTPRVVLDLVTVSFLLSYSNRPMQLFGKIGMISGGLGGLVALYLVSAKIINGIRYGMEGFRSYRIGTSPWLTLAVLMIMLGTQFLMMGLLGELLTRTYHEAQRKPIYAVRQVLETGGERAAIGVELPGTPSDSAGCGGRV